MLRLKYSAKPICKMDEFEIKAWSMALLTKIHYITGWVLPQSAEGLNIVVDQFEKKLKESYGMMNPDEIEYAFRTKGILVRDWGKSMNLSLIHEVLAPYLDERSEASNIEERLKAPPVQTIYSDAELLDMQRGDLEAAYQRIKRGKQNSLADYLCELLVKDGFVKSKEEIPGFISKMIGINHPSLYTK